MRLIKNEWIKIWSQRNAQIMFLLVIIAVIGFSSLNKYFSPNAGSKEDRLAANEEQLQNTEEMLASEGMFEEDRVYFEEEKQLIEYRITNDLPAEGTMVFHDNMDQSVSLTMMLVGIFTMVIAAAIVSSEFGTGTIKMLLTRPVARWKVLLSKLLASFAFGFALFVTGIVTAIIVSLILFPTDQAFTLTFENGEIVKTAMDVSYVDTYGKTLLYNGLSIMMTILFAFMLGSLFGSSTLAVSLALIIFLMGSMITMFISQYDFAKFIWFANDLSYYAPGSQPMLPDVTIGFSLAVNAVYAVIFLVVTFGYFMRRDIIA